METARAPRGVRLLRGDPAHVEPSPSSPVLCQNCVQPVPTRRNMFSCRETHSPPANPGLQVVHSSSHLGSFVKPQTTL
ncbi:hypothetical protein NDU88_006989 [Pleurodeles waltl]|uniref:Uncharacterized protein n=1 Tax=Pleurodeles waltl TaxID=8319 RepID=A0AAV7SRF3_PLEWA|nr:hypothetical protein NDU88_006989 [Pleurodeles waltl]